MSGIKETEHHLGSTYTAAYCSDCHSHFGTLIIKSGFKGYGENAEDLTPQERLAFEKIAHQHQLDHPGHRVTIHFGHKDYTMNEKTGTTVQTDRTVYFKKSTNSPF